MKIETVLGKILYHLGLNKKVLFVFSSLITAVLLCNKFDCNYLKT